MGSFGGVPKPTAEETALQRAQLSLIYRQDEDINAKKLRLIRGETSNFASLLKTTASGDLRASGGRPPGTYGGGGYSGGVGGGGRGRPNPTKPA